MHAAQELVFLLSQSMLLYPAQAHSDSRDFGYRCFCQTGCLTRHFSAHVLQNLQAAAASKRACFLFDCPSMPVSSHVLQYSFTNYLVAIIVALTLGQIGSSTPETPNFTTQVHQVRQDEGFALLADALLLGPGCLGSCACCLPAEAVSRPTGVPMQTYCCHNSRGLPGFTSYAGQASLAKGAVTDTGLGVDWLPVTAP